MTQSMHEDLTAQDLARLTEALTHEGLSRMEWSLDGFNVQIEWDAPKVRPAPGGDEAAATASPALVQPQPQAAAVAAASGPLRAPVAGTISWAGNAPPRNGDMLTVGQIVATIAAGAAQQDVVSPIDGQVAHAQPFEGGAFVACGQWLMSFQP